jgi:HEAT repeat protein
MPAPRSTNPPPLVDCLGVARLLDSIRALPWPEPIERGVRSSARCLGRRFPALATLFGLARSEPARAAQRRRPSRERRPRKPSVASLIAALRGPEPDAAVAAAGELGGRRSERAREALVEALRNRDGYTSPRTRIAALRALAKSLREGEEARLAEAARDVDPDVSLAAIEALAEGGGAAARDALEEIAEDQTVFVLPVARRAARSGLAELRARA